MAIIRVHSGLRDAWADTHPDVPTTFSPNATPLEVVHTFGVTADCPSNTYSAGKYLDDYARQFMGKRLDYVLYRPLIHFLRSPKTPILEPTQADVVLTEHVPGKSYSFSDHFGLEATFAIHLPEGQPGNVNNPSDIKLPAPAPNTIAENQPPGAKFDIIGLVVSSVWLPHLWVTPIFHFATTVLTWLATTMLYAGFIYGNYEANTLDNIIEELELYRETIRMN